MDPCTHISVSVYIFCMCLHTRKYSQQEDNEMAHFTTSILHVAFANPHL